VPGRGHQAPPQRRRPPAHARPERVAFRGSVSSYLGLRADYHTYRLRRRLMLEGLPPWWRKAARVDAGLRKVALKK